MVQPLNDPPESKIPDRVVRQCRKAEFDRLLDVAQRKLDQLLFEGAVVEGVSIHFRHPTKGVGAINTWVKVEWIGDV